MTTLPGFITLIRCPNQTGPNVGGTKKRQQKPIRLHHVRLKDLNASSNLKKHHLRPCRHRAPSPEPHTRLSFVTIPSTQPTFQPSPNRAFLYTTILIPTDPYIHPRSCARQSPVTIHYPQPTFQLVPTGSQESLPLPCSYLPDRSLHAPTQAFVNTKQSQLQLSQLHLLSHKLQIPFESPHPAPTHTVA